MHHVGGSHSRDSSGVELAGSLNPLNRHSGPLTGRRIVPVDLAIRGLACAETTSATGVIHMNRHRLPRTAYIHGGPASAAMDSTNVAMPLPCVQSDRRQKSQNSY